MITKWYLRKKEATKMVEEKKDQVQEEAKVDAAAEVKATEETKGAATAVADEKPKVELSKKMEGMISTIEEMSVLELSDLVKALEDKFGVSAAAPAMAMAAGAPAAGAAVEEEKSVFTVVLAGIGDKKINVIKEVRALTNLGLKEAKDLVEAAPKEVATDIPKEEAEKMKKQLEDVGAKVELK
jgi:large subunit ribosomal protein L7/L12